MTHKTIDGMQSPGSDTRTIARPDRVARDDDEFGVNFIQAASLTRELQRAEARSIGAIESVVTVEEELASHNQMLRPATLDSVSWNVPAISSIGPPESGVVS